MTTKDTIRSADRTKLKRRKRLVFEHYKELFDSELFCNLCRKVFTLMELDINHLSYEMDSYRYGELVCRHCHIKINNLTLKPFNEQKHIAPQTVLVFQKFLNGISIISKLENGRTVQRGRLRLSAGEVANPKVLMGIFMDN